MNKNVIILGFCFLSIIIYFSYKNDDSKIDLTINKNIESNVDSTEFENLLFSSVQELRKNKDFIFDLNGYFKNPKHSKPIGQLKYYDTKKLFRNHFDKVIRYSYGEEKYLFQIVLQLEDSNEYIKKIKNLKDYEQFNETYNMTFDDITFLNGFLFWYLAHLAKDELTPNLYNTLGYWKDKDDFEVRIDTSNLNMKYLDYPDFGYVTSYSNYLGFID